MLYIFFNLTESDESVQLYYSDRFVKKKFYKVLHQPDISGNNNYVADDILYCRKLYLNFNVSHFGSGTDDGSPDQSWKNVLGEIRAGISAFDKLRSGL